MTTTNLLVGFEEKTLFLELSRVRRDKGCSKPSFLLPDSAVELIKFLGVPQAEPLRGGFETFSQDSIWRCPVATPTHRQDWAVSRTLVQDVLRFIFFSASAASLQEKNHIAWPEVFISHLLSALSIFSHCLLSTLESKSWSEALGTGVSWIFWGMHHLINYKKKNDSFKKEKNITTFKFGKCFKFLNAALCFPA